MIPKGAGNEGQDTEAFIAPMLAVFTSYCTNLSNGCGRGSGIFFGFGNQSSTIQSGKRARKR